jgi:hypothetical protein
MFLPDTGAHHRLMRALLQNRNDDEITTPLMSIFNVLFKGVDAAFYEYAALISDGGSVSQRVHADSTYQPVCPVYTVFVALQDISSDLGPTVFIPGSHTEESHRAFRFDKHAMLSGAQYSHALLQQGDAVIMDSRLFHCGSANNSNPTCASAGSSKQQHPCIGGMPGRRSLLYFSLLNPDTVNMGHGSMFAAMSPTLHQMARG